MHKKRHIKHFTPVRLSEKSHSTVLRLSINTMYQLGWQRELSTFSFFHLCTKMALWLCHETCQKRLEGLTGMYSSGCDQLCTLLNIAENGTHTIVPFGILYFPNWVSLLVILLVPSPVTGYNRIDSCTACYQQKKHHDGLWVLRSSMHCWHVSNDLPMHGPRPTLMGLRQLKLKIK